MLFSELYKIMVNKFTFVSFRGDDRPNRPPLDPSLLKILLICRNCSQKMGIIGNSWKEKNISDSRSVEKHSNEWFKKWVLFNQHRLMTEPPMWLLIVQVHFRLSCVKLMGVGSIFTKEATRRFFQKFSSGDQMWWNVFFPTRDYQNSVFW